MHLFDFLFLPNYLLWVNMIALGLMLLDKFVASFKFQRVPEKLLFIACCIGGFVGIFVGIFLFRHKCSKSSFILSCVASTFVWVLAFILFKQ